MTDEDKPPSAADDDALIAECKRRLSAAIAAESQNREEALTDLRFLNGEQWDPQQKAQRDFDRRPTLTINKLPTFLAQVTNDMRQNKVGIKVHAVDDGADEESAEIFQGLIRSIEYGSNADVAYDTAGSSAAACGIGYWRLVTDFVSDDSFDQEILFDRIRNPFSVYPGPYKQPDGSDMRWCVIAVDLPRDEFVATYPKADSNEQSFDRGTGDGSPGWITQRTVRVAEYYRVECEDATLLLLSDGSTVYADEVPGGARALPPGMVVRKRRSERRKVVWYRMTGAEVLERTEIPCYWIPVFPVVGTELDIDGRVYRSGIVRNARDPAYLYNVWMSAATEEVALRPKVPYIGAEGQFEGHEKKWGTANVRNYSYLEYKPVTLDGQLAPPPQRQPMIDIPAGTITMARHAADDVKATTGLFDSSLGARGTATSGVQERAQQRQGDNANFHYTDNLARTIKQCGRCLLWMIPRIYDTPRVVRILGEDETPSYARVNEPLDQPQVDKKTGVVRRVLNDLKAGKYDLTVSMGPAYQTLRQEAAEAMIQFGQSWPKLMDVAGDKVVKAMDWPGADEIAERIARTIPPEIRDDPKDAEEEGGPPPLPPEVEQGIQQMQQQIQEMEAALRDASSGVEVARIRADAQVEAARIAAEGRNDVAELTGWVKLLAARMEPPPMLTSAAMTTGPAGSESFSPPESDAFGEQVTGVPLPDGQNGPALVE